MNRSAGVQGKNPLFFDQSHPAQSGEKSNSTTIAIAAFTLLAAVFTGLVYAEVKYGAVTSAVTWLIAHPMILAIALGILVTGVIGAALHHSYKNYQQPAQPIDSSSEATIQELPAPTINGEVSSELTRLQRDLSIARENLATATAEYDAQIQHHEALIAEHTALSGARTVAKNSPNFSIMTYNGIVSYDQETQRLENACKAKAIEMLTSHSRVSGLQQAKDLAERNVSDIEESIRALGSSN